MTERVVTIPSTPSAGLSPNARCHFRVKAKLVKDARYLARMACLEQHGQVKPLRAPVMLHAVIAWESRRKFMDVTNAIAALKSYEDGLVDAKLMGDDRGVAGWTLEQVRDPEKRGWTRITIKEVRQESEPLLIRSREELIKLMPELAEFGDFACFSVNE